MVGYNEYDDIKEEDWDEPVEHEEVDDEGNYRQFIICNGVKLYRKD
ncbi:MAG: hypothetical protein K6F00_11145 [Lachnospiraceae bacterium]|nr:hypothetical protein [Lachnospiraceae bacterium]